MHTCYGFPPRSSPALLFLWFEWGQAGHTAHLDSVTEVSGVRRYSESNANRPRRVTCSHCCASLLDTAARQWVLLNHWLASQWAPPTSYQLSYGYFISILFPVSGQCHSVAPPINNQLSMRGPLVSNSAIGHQGGVRSEVDPGLLPILSPLQP